MKLKILIYITIALLCVILVFSGIWLAAFKYSEEKIETTISIGVSKQTGQASTDLSVTTLEVIEKHNVRVINFQYNGKDGVERGTAIFSKLPFISQYRSDKLFLGYTAKHTGAVIDTGLTDEMVLINDQDITISTEGLGTVSGSLIQAVLITFGLLFLRIVVSAFIKKEEKLIAETADSLKKE